jgi:hypothetical protein
MSSNEISPTADDDHVLENRRNALFIVAMVLTLLLIMRLALTPRPLTPDLARLKIDPNKVPVGVLEALPRVGKTIANRIVEIREDAPFLDMADLAGRVRGVGKTAIAEMNPHLKFANEAALERNRANSK